jgi:hypothetical protein
MAVVLLAGRYNPSPGGMQELPPRTGASFRPPVRADEQPHVQNTKIHVNWPPLGAHMRPAPHSTALRGTSHHVSRSDFVEPH